MGRAAARVPPAGGRTQLAHRRLRMPHAAETVTHGGLSSLKPCGRAPRHAREERAILGQPEIAQSKVEAPPRRGRRQHREPRCLNGKLRARAAGDSEYEQQGGRQQRAPPGARPPY